MSNPRNDDYGPAGERWNDAPDPRGGRGGPAYDQGAAAPTHRETYIERDHVGVPAQERFATEPRPNPLAGILLIIGGLMGVLAGLVPDGGDVLPIAGTIDLFRTGQSEPIVLAVAIILVFVCGLGALAAGAQMFAPKLHASAARTGMTMGILMLIAALAVVIVVGTGIFESAGFSTWMLLAACVPTIVGALIGYARK